MVATLVSAKLLVRKENVMNINPTNEFWPFFLDPQENAVKISEYAEIGTFLDNTDGGLNGEFRCHHDHDEFQLEALGINKYKVVLRSLLDREMADRPDIPFRCQDNGFRSRRNESKFLVKDDRRQWRQAWIL